MGMDWVVLDKEEGGRKVDAWETLGARRLNKADPDTVEAFRQRYESNRAALAARPRRRSLLQRAFELLGDVSEEEKQRRYWERPFEEVLDDAASQSPPPVMVYASEENQDGLAAVSGGAVRVCDFRVKELLARHNDVVAATNFDDERLTVDLGVEEMRAVADDLEAALSRYRETPGERNEADAQTVEDAVEWLRFWAGKGHAIALDY